MSWPCVPLDETVADADAVVLVTAHPEVDDAAVAARSALLVDLRGVTRGIHIENRRRDRRH
jgi:UDP-N-acetyl-D-mannosaminuronate dehydrogenase